MFGLDNPSGINVMPTITPTNNSVPLWFTEGGAGLSASYPGQEWFNQVQAELLGVLKEAGITPDKSKLNQLAVAIKSIVANGITLTDRTGNSSKMAASQKLVTEVNENANSRLEKNQNGADIPNKPKFVENLGLTGTVDLAKNAYPKTGGQITGKVYADDDIEAKGWVGGTTLHDRHKDGRWSRGYSEAFPPSAAVVGAYSIKEAGDRFALKKSSEMFSCGGVDVEATHDWAGIKLINATGYYVQLSATPHENADMLRIMYRDKSTATQYYAILRKKSGDIALMSDVADNASIGINQSWRNVRSQRIGGSQYYNDAGRPIAVFVKTKKREESNVALGIGASVNGVQVAYNWSGLDGPHSILSVFFIVPVGANYEVNAHRKNEGDFIESWAELR
ncbi:tail fiber protein [Xenorhabdus sp. XENO-7]|uniref:Tail fiber protein n=1 Tax=Xenorhabdus aichiensis TaxID=3025874 RepID=A0ABT5LY69_9GAMM|nr:tail fiber protein [Xenorhabdus aichiensis]MDC9620151.1 tail fiber protein [Xenorhabdus aichiensis]